MPTRIITAFIFFLFALSASAQQPADKDALQRQREQLKKDIEETEKALIENRKTTKVNIGQLSLINKKMDLQGNVINNISSEIKKLNDNIYLSQLEINKIKRILDTLKVEYAKSMVYAYKNRSNYDFLNFIFSANNFNDAIKRIAYLKSYRTYREMQAENILKTQSMLEDKIEVLSGTKKQKNVVLSEQDKELDKLAKQKEEKATVVNQLKGRQKELLAQVKAKRKQDAKIKNAITAMIRREIEIAKAEAARKEKERLAELKKNKPETAEETKEAATAKTTKPAASRSNSVLVSSEADKALNASFEKNKGSLPWPADGFVISHFGANQYPGGIDYNNPGVSIGTKVGASVKAVFDGEVTLVSYIDNKQAVFIKHGKYFTVYSNLASANVQRGAKVRTGQVIGTADANDEGQGEVDFILMKESDNVNPESWLRH
ncbi:MAG TPA: peptidoglycan DD-metalloendopeptidase family protein [Hanamia sp.]|jgi:murein hydrolase activator|nr:peptidoglycan DD-metalloendopeptidase family protein [Hanamia sp.]